MNFAANDLETAFSASEEAVTTARSISSAPLANQAKAYVGAAEIYECVVTARRNDPKSASKYCDDAVTTLDPMQKTDGGKFEPYVARAFFFRGTVEGAMQQWIPAQSDFERAEKLWGEVAETGQSNFRNDQVGAAEYSMLAAFQSGDLVAAAKGARHAAELAEGLESQFLGHHKQVLTEAAQILDRLGNREEATELLQKRDALTSIPKK